MQQIERMEIEQYKNSVRSGGKMFENDKN